MMILDMHLAQQLPLFPVKPEVFDENHQLIKLMHLQICYIAS